MLNKEIKYVVIYGYGHTLTAELIAGNKVTIIKTKLLSNSFGNAKTQLKWWLESEYNLNIEDITVIENSTMEESYNSLYKEV